MLRVFDLYQCRASGEPDEVEQTTKDFSLCFGDIDHTVHYKNIFSSKNYLK